MKITTTTTTTTMMGLLLGSLVFGGACDSLKNPGHIVSDVTYTSDGKLTLFFYDGLATVDDKLQIGTWTPYPVMDKMVFGHGLSADGARAVVAWNDEGNHQLPDGTIAPPRDKPGIVVFAAGDGQIAHSWELPHHQVALSGNGDTLLVSGLVAEGSSSRSGRDLAAFSVADGDELWRLTGDFPMFAFIPGANAIATVVAAPTRDEAGALRVVELGTGATRLEVPLPAGDSPAALAVSSDGTVAAVGTGRSKEARSSDTHYFVVDLADGRLVRELLLPDRYPMSDLTVSSGGRFVAGVASITGLTSPTVNDGRAHDIVLWNEDTITYREPVDMWGHYGQVLAFSPDGAQLTAALLHGVDLRSVPDGKLLRFQSYRQEIF